MTNEPTTDEVDQRPIWERPDFLDWCESVGMDPADWESGIAWTDRVGLANPTEWPCVDCGRICSYDDDRGYFHVDPDAESCFLIPGVGVLTVDEATRQYVELDEGPTCSICDGLGHGYPGGPPCPLEDRGSDDRDMDRGF